jgi:hypothetical protein
VERQFNPYDTSFIPRAFSISHVNLTHRNWTAVGHPNLALYPIVDPRGLVTPLFDGWSIDMWIVTCSEKMLLPSKLPEGKQRWILSPNLAVESIFRQNSMKLDSNVSLNVRDHSPVLDIAATGWSREEGWLVVALRPYNPEGIQFIEKVRFEKDNPGWIIDSHTFVNFSQTPEKVLFSEYHEGDVLNQLNKPEERKEITCNVGMATAAALFPISANNSQSVRVEISLKRDMHKHSFFPKPVLQPITESWDKELTHAASLKVPDEKIQYLYDAAVRTLILLSAEDIVPGPYTYRRFWFRDACLMLNSLLALGLTSRVFKILDSFPDHQKVTGYFQSQEGEWDSNGQVIWIMDRFQRITGHRFNHAWMKAVKKGADWIIRKRLKKKPESPHAGLFPPGFSAEHLGPNDYYYWDDFWGLAGLQGAARLAGIFDSADQQGKYEREAQDFEKSIFKSIDTIAPHRSWEGIPASPYRRMDSGAIGSMVADYPLQLIPAGNRRIINTTEFLMKHCFHKGAFFQDMIHSGINAYLTLDIAQTLLRNKDVRYQDLIRTVAQLATSTGQWPEAIHPLTNGGCMGDGQHGWAAAEWAMMIRNLFVREDGASLILGSGILPEWTAAGLPVGFGPTQTPFGPVEVSFFEKDKTPTFEIKADFSKTASLPSDIIIEVPGYKKQKVSNTNQQHFFLSLRK